MGSLDGVLGGGTQSVGSRGMSPITVALLRLLPYHTFHGQGKH
jgi:hypothetical protein